VRLKRLNVDLVEGDHRALKLWAATAGVEVSQLVRAMLELTRTSPRWRTEVEGLAAILVEGGRGARP
jgi:16S rRNA U516 pseudouridylate synthase RsuA-like enzyme